MIVFTKKATGLIVLLFIETCLLIIDSSNIIQMPWVKYVLLLAFFCMWYFIVREVKISFTSYCILENDSIDIKFLNKARYYVQISEILHISKVHRYTKDEDGKMQYSSEEAFLQLLNGSKIRIYKSLRDKNGRDILEYLHQEYGVKYSYSMRWSFFGVWFFAAMLLAGIAFYASGGI